MEGPYQINFSISREDARKLLADLATDDDLRGAVEADAAEALRGRGIDISEGMLPDKVVLPPKREIAHILYAGDSALGETASPFGLLVLVVVFGAMPLTMRRSSAGDGAG
jgi:hypothetical protein